MKLNKQQKIGLVLLGLCVAAVMVDRVFLLPESASATTESSSSSSQQSQIVVTTVANVESNTVTPNEELANKLESLWTGRDFNPAQTRDAFSLPASWGVDPNAQQDTANQAPKPDPAAQFKKAHKLNAVVLNSQGGKVMIDTRFLTIGGKIDGFELVKIEEDSATFEADGLIIVLKLRNDRYLQLNTQKNDEVTEFHNTSRD